MQRAAHAAELVDRSLGGDDRVTQFEALTAAAYSELARREVEVAVIEAGLGGRYDATNVIPSRVQVLTSVGLEHTRWLGPTIADIAAEKLDVVQPGATLVLGPDLHPDALERPRRVAAERGATIVQAGATPASRSARSGRSSDATSRWRGPPPRRTWASSTATRSRPRRPRSACPGGCRSSARTR